MMKKGIFAILAVLIVTAMVTVSCDDDTKPSTKKWTVTFNYDGGSVTGSVTEKTRSVAKGAAVGALPAPTKDGFVFDGWFNGNTQWTAATLVTANVTLKAKWTARAADKWVVTFDYASGTGTETSRQVTKGAAIGPLPTATRSGYTLDGWYYPATTKWEAATTVTADVTLTAKWTAVAADKWAVTFNYDGGTGTETSRQVAKGAAVGALPAPTKDGFVFDGWFNGNTQWTATTTVTADVTLTAKWTKGQTTIVVDKPEFTVSSESPYAGTATINGDGTYTIGGTSGNNTGGAMLYKFPAGYADIYDKVSVAYTLVSKEGPDTNTNAEIAFRTYNTRSSYGYGANGYPDLMIKDNNPLEFFIRGAGTTGGFAFEYNAYNWEDNNRFNNYQISVQSITFSKVEHHDVTFNVGYTGDGAPTYPARDYLDNTPISFEGALPAPSRSGFVFDGWFDGPGDGATQITAATLVTADLNLVGKWTEGSLKPLVISNPTFSTGGGATGNVSDGYTLNGGAHIIGFEFPSTLGSYTTVTFATNITNNDTTATPKLTVKNVKMGYSPDIASNQYKDLPTAGGDFSFDVPASQFSSGFVTFQHNGGNYTIKITSITLTP